jgi:hypothetical protein
VTLKVSDNLKVTFPNIDQNFLPIFKSATPKEIPHSPPRPFASQIMGQIAGIPLPTEEK